jgi:ATP-dependent RNA helicase DDX31/DBP7
VLCCAVQALEPRISRGEGTYAIVVAPTRELCIQITDVLCLILRRYFWMVRPSRTT